MRCDQRTKDYVARRIAEGLSKKEIIRCLKRAIVREIYRVICTKRSTPQPRDLRRDELKELRIAKHLTQAVVADSLGLLHDQVTTEQPNQMVGLEGCTP